MMKFYRTVATCATYVILMQSPNSFAQSHIFLPAGRQVNLGTLYESQKTHYVIPVKNIGRDSLHIRKVTASCGCTAAKSRREFLAPGDSSGIDVTFVNDDINGPSARHVYISSNDTGAGPIDITFNAKVIPVLKADPRYISFGKIPLHSTRTRILRLQNTLEDTIRILASRVEDPRVNVVVGKNVIAPHEAVEVRAECAATSEKKLLGQIEFSTSSPLKPVLKVSYTGTIVR